jgi:hypothetical protein
VRGTFLSLTQYSELGYRKEAARGVIQIQTDLARSVASPLYPCKSKNGRAQGCGHKAGWQTDESL